MRYDTLLFEIRDAIARITINRPDKLNALNDQVVDELADAAERVATEPAIRGAILTGSGTKAFVAGADIADLSKQGPFDGKARAQRGQAMLRRFETCGKPVIAAVNGYALGSILEMGPLAVRLALEAVDQGLEMTLEEGLLLEANHFGLLAATEDMREGLTAFLEKRPPKFRGK